MNELPLARSKDIVVQESDKEVLVYDLNTHKAFNLNETSATVYRACDGKTSFDEVRAKNNFTDDIIFLALDELERENLINNSKEYNSPFNGLSRREVIRRAGFASMTALPVISLLVAPTAAMAQSCVNPGGFPPGTPFGFCSGPEGSTTCTPTFCVRPSGTPECCSDALTNAPGGCVTAGGTISCNCECA